MLQVQEAIDILEILGSCDDPIWYKGVETTPNSLEYIMNPLHLNPANIKIQYFGKNGLSNGTLTGMIKDRMYYT